uniref:Uncharacterized protein n=1 Tax=Rhodococcus hoagii TaxID=43767 RepID=A0A1Z1UYQ8_RHOHA|nr:hypothetical protein pVAPB1413_0401 [Prescottella equi]ARX60638.1 hypothetical protein pVAPB1533_0401 [Prescottella equi]
MGDTFWFLPLPFETLRWLAATYPCLVDFRQACGR